MATEVFHPAPDRGNCTRPTKCASSILLTISVFCQQEEERFDLDLLIVMKFVFALTGLLCCGGAAAQREGCAYLEVRYQEDT
jgi:hypothetical protein